MLRYGALKDGQWLGRKIKNAHRLDGEGVHAAMTKCGMLDILCEKTDLYTKSGDNYIPLNQQVLKIGDWVLPRKVRDYRPIQNVELANAFAGLPYELVGVGQVGRYGELSFIQYKLPEYRVGGLDNELHADYLFVGDNKMIGGTYYGLTSRRFICENVWNSIQRQIRPIPHNADSHTLLKFTAQIEHQMIVAHANEVDQLNRMFTARVDDVNDLINRMYPDPKPTRKMALLAQGAEYGLTLPDIEAKVTNIFETAVSRATKRRQKVAENYVNFEGDGAGTMYAFFNAVTQTVNHSSLYNGSDTKALISIMSGTRQKDQARAWALAKC